eukprot:CAMPEP_0115559272 /NCGR_PEP_ID=MMETSP0271-20121206/99873_1 /TAXON_ID=71861 /ORGANISM="Scrippsiella trochoidea, Strain CCMP3099" /LENGTH=61 /DNA_ID=CAMNT_0002993323 /DNA_START=84 /DNA_END=266 /DNA_ORIENTATION=+
MSLCWKVVSEALIRTATVLFPKSTSRKASMTFLRAVSFCEGATESSKSKTMTSAADFAAFG